MSTIPIFAITLRSSLPLHENLSRLARPRTSSLSNSPVSPKTLPSSWKDLKSFRVIIGGIAFLAQWAAARFRDWSALFLAMVAFVVGFAGLAIKLEWLGPETRARLPALWPALLVLGGLVLLLRGLFSRRS